MYFFFAKNKSVSTMKKWLFLDTIQVKLGLWGDSVELGKKVLSFVLALAFTADTECLASAVVQQQPVLLAWVVS